MQLVPTFRRINGATIFRTLIQEDEKDLAEKLATRTSTRMHDFTSHETVALRQKIYLIVYLLINFLKHCSTFMKYYSLGVYIRVRKKQNLKISSPWLP